MPIIPWRCAHGDAPWVFLLCQPTLELGAADSDRVIVTGEGTITSLGRSPADAERGVPCTKTIYFEPAGIIEILPGPTIALLGSGSRIIEGKSFAVFSCDGLDHWTENSFVDLAWSPHDLDELIDIVEVLAANNHWLKKRIEWLRNSRRGWQEERRYG